jgi:uncharacterized membrane-anchored protein YitT (DUF2179 family)
MSNDFTRERIGFGELWIPAVLALVMAVNYNLFIFPNAFAPAGINGIATMIQYLFHISIGYLSLLINVPLLIMAWNHVDRDYCVKSLVYVLVFSGANILLQSIDLSAFIYYNQNGNSAILGPVAAGVIAGAVNGLAIHNNGSTGGTDIIAAYLHVRKPGYSLVWVIFVLNASVAFMSYFVYGFRFEPVIMCIIYSYLIAAVSDRMLRGMKKAYKFEVITERGEELSDELIRELRHGVTVLHAEGMYSRSDKDLLICIVNRQQLVHFRRILNRYPGSFSYVTEVAETVGNFKNVKEN